MYYPWSGVQTLWRGQYGWILKIYYMYNFENISLYFQSTKWIHEPLIFMKSCTLIVKFVTFWAGLRHLRRANLATCIWRKCITFCDFNGIFFSFPAVVGDRLINWTVTCTHLHVLIALFWIVKLLSMGQGSFFFWGGLLQCS